MSLVSLKKVVLGEKGTAPSHLTQPSYKLDRPQTPGSTRTVTDADLESQRPYTAGMDEPSSKKPSGFQIDARVVSDATIGLADGLTVPFALTAGLSALGDTNTVIFGGLAELIAGAISMGLGGYLGAKSEDASYHETRKSTEQVVRSDPQSVVNEIHNVFAPYELPTRTLVDVTAHLSSSPRIVDFLMQFQHCAEEPASSRAFTSAVTIAMGYFLGGLLPLIPYFCVGHSDLLKALYISIGVMAVALFSFGYVKTCAVTGWGGQRNVWKGVFGGVQMMIIGGAAAGAAMGLVKAFNHFVDS